MRRDNQCDGVPKTHGQLTHLKSPPLILTVDMQMDALAQEMRALARSMKHTGELFVGHKPSQLDTNTKTKSAMTQRYMLVAWDLER